MNIFLPKSVACALRFVCLGLLFFSAAFGADSVQSPALAKKAKPYRVCGTDQLRITVVQEDDLTSIVHVDAKGAVNLKLVGEVTLAGLTIREAEIAVQNAYRDGRFLKNPQVTINVEVYAQREVSIQGEVKNPGRYPLPAETVMTVLDLVTRAGGFTDTAKGSEVKVTRFRPDGRVERVFVINVESIIRGKGQRDVEEDTSLELEPNDVVFVPQRLI